MTKHNETCLFNLTESAVYLFIVLDWGIFSYASGVLMLMMLACSTICSLPNLVLTLMFHAALSCCHIDLWHKMSAKRFFLSIHFNPMFFGSCPESTRDIHSATSML